MFTSIHLLDILNPVAQQINKPDAPIVHLCFDSRKVLQPAATLFFAIQTEHRDGHDYIRDMMGKGVVNFVITRNIADYQHYANCNFFQVAHAVAAMQQLAAWHRAQFHYPVIGITGSNGKTIVKEWLAVMLADQYNLIKNPNSYNSQIGVPFSVWQMNGRHNLAVFEAGISHPGEMEALARVIQPTTGIITNIGTAHSQYFTDHLEKTKEKLKLFANAEALIYCCDHAELHELLKDDKYQHLTKISWGQNSEACYKLTQKVTLAATTKITLDDDIFTIPFTDAASVENALHIVALLRRLNYAASEINEKLQRLAPISMRLEIQEAVNRSLMINDTYSLDLSSLRIALDFLVSQAAHRSKTLILSDFEQATPLTESDYEDINELLRQKNIARLLSVGEQLKTHQHQFHLPEQHFFNSTAELLQHFSALRFDHEAILIKGARNFKFERIVDLLRFKTHKTILQVSLPAIVNNLNYYRSFLKPDTKMVAMVKALCYGLGDAELINELIYNNIDYLAVAYADEGVRLRQRHIHTPIIVLGAEGHSFEMMLNWGLEPEIFNFYYLEELIKILSYHTEIEEFKIHLKFDTGIHRLGFEWQDIDKLMAVIKRAPQLKVVSIFSHLAAAEDENEDAFTRGQIALFKQICDCIKPQLPYPVLCHILNSAGISRFADEAQLDMVRLGLGLYGYSYIAKDLPHLQDPVTLKTVITEVKSIGKGETVGYNRTFMAQEAMTLAIIPIGYADGLPSELSNGVGKALVRGKLVPIIGKICMDMCMIDVSGLTVSEGDEVEMYGHANPLDKVAISIGKIPYELLTAIARRVPRVYVME
ncbi:MAG: bifunctional UDP-N-acetylmuramoyl-tripeptide:D-alanyl-D-alanine ligase/alanine racemase [Bacteroidales bacterium]|jgi:alanine racemase|nr:bifunctional UDP-N-acetylmuramoyl-tripeptide:D-alanyl-D-alanine ligase/alanine racemase [Bacteroidales bacterium]